MLQKTSSRHVSSHEGRVHCTVFAPSPAVAYVQTIAYPAHQARLVGPIHQIVPEMNPPWGRGFIWNNPPSMSGAFGTKFQAGLREFWEQAVGLGSPSERPSVRAPPASCRFAVEAPGEAHVPAAALG